MIHGTTQQNQDYLSRINKVIDYIEYHPDKSFTLEELSSVASFSKFHFTRIFQALTGETPFQFVLRLRIERAATLICSHKNESITQIAFRCGFSDLTIFSRNFSKYFHCSPSQYRRQKSNISQMLRNNHQDADKSSAYFCFGLNSLKWKTDMKLNKSVEVKDLPKMTIAYIRHIGPYKGNEKLFETLWNKLFSWAGPRGLVGGKDFRSLIIYHDDPNITSEDKLRMSVCITVPPDTRTNGEIGKMELEAARYMKARFEVTAEEFAQAWDWVYGQWLPTSGYIPDDKPCFEMYPEEPKDGKFVVDICVPVKPM
jgi:AraC family transcriptional regulator